METLVEVIHSKSNFCFTWLQGEWHVSRPVGRKQHHTVVYTYTNAEFMSSYLQQLQHICSNSTVQLYEAPSMCPPSEMQRNHLCSLLHRYTGDCGSAHPLTFSPSHCLTYCRYSIDRRTDMDHLFSIYPGNGSVLLLKGLDREEAAWHNISIVATEFSKSSRGWVSL